MTMPRRIRMLAGTISLAVGVLSFSASAMVHLDGVAAVVGDEVILLSEVEAYILMRLNDGQTKPDTAMSDATRRQYLQELIDGKVLLVHAKEDTTISIKDDEVEQALQNHLEQLRVQNNLSAEQFERELSREGLTLQKFKSQLRRGIREQLLKQRVQQTYVSRYQPSRQDVEQFYNQYRDSLPSMGISYRIRQLTITTEPTDSMRQAAYERINTIRTKLTNGEDFTELAKKYSEGPDAENGGMLGFIGKGTLSELSFEEKAFATPIGEYSEPFLSSLGWHIVKVLSKKNQQVEVQQIFIAIEPSKNLEAQASARMDSIRTAVKAPADFIAAIRALSTDKRTRDRDGDIGWITEYTLKSKYPEAFADFQVGSLSAPVPISGGFIMLMIYAVDPDRKLNLVDDWDILFEKTRDIYAQKKLQEMVQKWRTETLVDIRL